MVETRVSSFGHEFCRTEAAGGTVLAVCASVALVIANSGWADAYHRLWAVNVTIGAGGHDLSLSLHQWINDGLMAVFFLMVGLEIKREGLAGELAAPRQALLPIAGAIGGMLVPALIYVLVAGRGAGSRGWAIPMATDIAFALGTLAVIAPRAPGGLKIFLAALAIVDDIGAVFVIAFFYTTEIVWHAVALSGLCLLALIALNIARVRALTPYLVIGLVLWFFVHASGVHATIAGILLALTIPARTRIDAAQYSVHARRLLDEFDRTETGDSQVLTSKGQQSAIFAIGHANLAVLAPVLRLEHALHGFSAFVIMPVFAIANAGVSFRGVSVDQVTIAVVLGLVAGKPLGIMGASLAAVRSGAAALPEGANWTAMLGCTWFAGIGFTMSLFIAMLAFEGSPLLDSAKVGILLASVCAAVAGAPVMRRGLRAS